MQQTLPSFVHLADPHDGRAADGACALQPNELGAIRADALVAARHEHVRVAAVHADAALAAAEQRFAWEALRERLASAWASTTVDAHSCDSCCARRAATASPSLSSGSPSADASLSCTSLSDTALVRSCM